MTPAYVRRLQSLLKILRLNSNAIEIGVAIGGGRVGEACGVGLSNEVAFQRHKCRLSTEVGTALEEVVFSADAFPAYR
jgi:hypothetical protein